MIYVREERLCHVEYLIHQSMQGNHLLFDLGILKRALSETAPFCEPISQADAYAVEPHIERLLEEPSLSSQRAYLETLDRLTLESVVRAYFNIVENSLFEQLSERSLREGEVRH